MSQRYDFPCMCATVESFFNYEYPHFPPFLKETENVNML